MPSHSLQRAIARGIAYCSDDRKRDGVFQIKTVAQNLTRRRSTA